MGLRRVLTDNQVRAIHMDTRSSRVVAAAYGVNKSTVRRIRTGRTYQEVSGLPAPNTYMVGDCLDILRSLPEGFVRGVATNPPDNLDVHQEGVYVEQQRAMLTESLRIVGPSGLVCYNTNWPKRNLRQDRREEILEGLPVRQTVIWYRKMTTNQGGADPTFLSPRYEVIEMLAGDKWVVPKEFRQEGYAWGDVWEIPPKVGDKAHPVEWPIELARRFVRLVNGPVLDPYAGSGTLGIAAAEIGLPYYLIDISPEYRKVFVAASGDR